MIGFTAVIEEARGGGALVALPDEVVEKLGGGGRFPVRATFDGIPYQGSVATYSGRRVLGMLKSIREELGKGPGDTVRLELERDDGERTVEIPPELEEAFSFAPGSREKFKELSYSHQREHVLSITDASKPETRKRRALRTVESLLG